MQNTTHERSYIALANLVHDHERKLQAIRSDCQSLIRKLEQAMRNCDDALAGQPYAINPLGVVQSNGPDIDRQCAELQMLSDAIRRLRFVIGKEGGAEGQ